VSSDAPTSEIPFPVTGSIPIYQEPVEEERKPSRQPLLWWALIVAAGSMLTAMTFPGQTAGLSPFTDPLIDSLDIDRTAISQLSDSDAHGGAHHAHPRSTLR
jgi:hypothetical protein